jgi:anti-sigma regulatory factor (Ser/Thr protein kinase)
MHKGRIVTSAQARDLSYGRRELPSNGILTGSPRVRDREMPAQEGSGPQASATGGLREFMLIPGSESVSAAREFTAATLRNWKLDGLVEEAVIVASELVTNAIRHGMCWTGADEDTAGVELAWQRQADQVVCVVTDCSSMPPVLEQADMSAESGRGLQVVSALAAAWGWVVLSAREKAVWAAFLAP